MQRPTGITVLAILAAIGGVFGILGGLALIGVGTVVAGATGLGGLAAILGLIALAYGVLSLVLAYGFWTLQPWAWTLGVGLEVAGIVINVLQYINNTSAIGGTIFSIAINAIVLWYLYQPNVKAAFGRT
jgi:uncharacterized membrane protein (DUF2068 family)